MPVPLVKVADDLSLKQIERGEQRGCPISFVVMGHRSAAPLLHRQTGLSAVQCLNLTLLIHAQDDGPVGWIQVQPDDIGELFQKSGIARELESLAAMRLEIVAPQDVTDRRLTHALSRRQGSTTPMCTAFGFRLQSCVDDRLDTFRTVGRLASASRGDLPQPR